MSKTPRYTRLALALAASLTASTAFAQEQTAAQADANATPQNTSQANKQLDRVVVTGSLIPQSEIETSTPVTVITAEDIKSRGLSTVADVLKESSFSTGGVQNNQSSASFTQGAETMSMFGLPAGYVKYLIDGRPMANYPALYNGSDVFNNISGVPIDLVERIEILPGGASSLYGSDAIAGVVNIILKKRVDGTIVSARYGWYDEGGGKSYRASVADSFSSADDKLNVLVGVQAEKSDPIWAYDRDLTKQFNTNGYNGAAPLASRDWLVYSPFTSYKFLDPANCANVSSGFGGTVDMQTRPGFGDENYCGSMYTPGYRTLKNSKDGVQLYVNTTYDIDENNQFYTDVLLSSEKVKYHIGSSYTWWGTGVKWGYYYDPNLDDFLNLQRAFTPEDMGDWENSMAENKSRSYHLNVGFRGTMGSESNWDYDIGVSRTEYRLDEKDLARLADPINDFFQDRVLGDQLGWDPYYGAYPIFTPDYAAFYQMLTPQEFYSFMGETVSKSKTYDNMIRAMFTNGSLFQLPGGDAGIAVGAEVGTQGWEYNPDARLLNGEIWGTTAVSGQGDRSRYAVVGELRLPVWEPLTISASARYDGYRAAGNELSKPTYSLAFEYRPIQSLLVRGKYGTAFRSPSLADQFQGVSGFYSTTTDYYNCQLLGFEPGNTDGCPARFSNVQYFGQQAGNPELEPINAKAWTAGVVFAPTGRFSISADYLNWQIEDEVAQQSVDQLMRDEMFCRTGQLDINSGTCVAALSQVVRGSAGTIQSIFVNKINVARRDLEAVNVAMNYQQPLGGYGDLFFNANWTKNLKHVAQTYPTDPEVDLLNDPYYSSDPKYRANASLGWKWNRFSSTVYANHIGPTPNYRAQLSPTGYAFAGAGQLSSYTTYNASLGFDVTEDFELSFMVNNLTNKMPDMDVRSYPGSSGAPYNGSNFSPYGRAYYLEARWNFGKSE
ncbi:TonB-dependent receptor plug domain-containing protein [Solilutibacter tolerans]|uniref:TonB-dependent Receptor Plug Domain n=1 Tax=Solilutibacter tolerans TaxID=1604334 RepID=A0A1N6VR61_9GAMM|nr:TonB-dependent receptor [Lysobacter tolerans]SIQ80299.1 TonB-dependent Receptor Plug Domain [Lysobacter tolerans]